MPTAASKPFYRRRWWMPAFSVFLGLLMLGAFWLGDEPGTGFASLGIMVALAALFLCLLIVGRGASALLWARELDRRETIGLALFGATGLPLIVAIVGIGVDRGAVSTQVGASLIGAGMLSVLIFPLLAMRVVGGRVEPGRLVAEEY